MEKVKKWNWRKIVMILVLSLLIFAVTWFFRQAIINFLSSNFDLKNPKEKIDLKNFLVGIAGLIGLIFHFRRTKAQEEQNKIQLQQLEKQEEQFLKNLKNQTQQIENETKQIASDQFSRQNQQFLDAIKIFDESKTLESKKGALFHLENLALSSPAHRQRVLDFLNSLNGWMREHEEELKNADFKAWRNEKKLLLEENIVSRETQVLSAEIPKIYENIIRKHNEEFSSFSEEDKEKYALDFSYFVFSEANFSRLFFPQGETQFVSCVFFGSTNFCNTNFLGCVNFWKACFLGHTNFWETCFFGEARFWETSFSKHVNFWETKCLEKTIFWKTQFLAETRFLEVLFSERVDFLGACFVGRVLFWETQFSDEILAQDLDFQKCPIRVFDIFEKEKEDDFLSLENFKKFQSAGALFSAEQIAYFENLEKSTPSN